MSYTHTKKEKGDLIRAEDWNAMGQTLETLSQHVEKLERQTRHLFDFDKTYTNSIGIDFILIPAGTFKMGSNSGPSNEAPEHLVTIRDSFYLGKYSVTQEQWKAVMGTNPSKHQEDKCPVERVSWNMAQEFIKKLNEKESNTLYQLPSEAQWEYACRAGTTSAYSFGNDKARLDEYAWYDNNSGNTTHPVGQKKPNPWGLYDMHGNVWDWVKDFYHNDYQDAPEDDSAWVTSSSYRCFRGGSFYNSAYKLASTYRTKFHLNDSDYRIGFRLLRKC